MRTARVMLCAVCSFAAIVLCSSAAPAEARVRTYYIAADEVVWNYAPSGRDRFDGKPLPALAPLQVGWAYRKALYRGYTDATFRHLSPRSPQDAYLGMLGPLIRAEVGDTVKVVFKNNTRLHLSVHPHGLLYRKDSEGAPYDDGSSGKDRLDDAVPPGGTYTYTWEVPERAGPGRMDASSVLWMYHSHTDEVNDVVTGPIGPIIVTARGMANPDGSPKGVDREVVTMFSATQESLSKLFSATLADPLLNPHHVKAQPGFPFLVSNELAGINGFSYGNMPMLTFARGEHVRWYLMASMQDSDFHAPDWHGQTVLENGVRENVTELGPMQMKSVEMIPDNPGIWEFNCDLNVHTKLMSARFEVRP